ncbi:MAG: hypothetical protein RL417_1937 [Pseudomonadota bacterium]|jgi:membrane protein implicated in regulation of membrane protease activity
MIRAQFREGTVPLGKMFIFIGLGLALAGVILLYAPGVLTWFGRLPGDIRVERPGLQFYFPLTSLIVVSVVLSLVWRFFGR